MKRIIIDVSKKTWVLYCVLAIVFIASSMQDVQARTVTIHVMGSDNQVITDFKWLAEQGLVNVIPGVGIGSEIPGAPGTYLESTLSTEFHRSYTPPFANGDGTNPTVEVADNQRYFVSVLPNSGYALGGAPIYPGVGDTEIMVFCNKLPIPTAQITVFVYEDNQPTNNIADLPAESGLAGFTIQLEEAGGKYGMSAGIASQDAFGNRLGTTYQKDGSGNFILDSEGLPIVDVPGSGIKTDANGMAVIKNLSPAKYGIIAVPPEGSDWVQTSTIEGKKVIDAWVKANEPSYFVEFGPPGWHVAIGFVRPTFDLSALNGSTFITGQVVNNHLSRAPDYAFYNGGAFPHTTPWIALNSMAVGGGHVIYAQRTAEGGYFAIPNVPPGDYQLSIWDDYLDLVVGFYNLTVPPGGEPIFLGEVSVFQWFARLENWVFYDANENGVMDEGEKGMREQAINLRFRDGSMYQSFPTDLDGFVPFDEVFPFFHWLVAEVDFTRFKATGVTAIVDNGGPILGDDPWTDDGQLNPQPQSVNDPANTITSYIGNEQIFPGNDQTGKFRTETGPVLTQGFQAFLGQTSVLQWGKKEYGPGENGGITGVVYYAVTRAENDPRYAVAEPWEPGIPRVQVNLYEDMDQDTWPDDLNLDNQVTLADVDNYPFGWKDGGAPGAEDVDRNGNGTFDMGDAIQVTTTDSWDDSTPTGSIWLKANGDVDPAGSFVSRGRSFTDFDGLRNFNQVRPGVFDGGYAFNGLDRGVYIVEAVPPQSYEILKEEHKNVDFGDSYVPSTLKLAPPCVGDYHYPPAYLSLFPDQQVPCVYAGQQRRLSDRKQVVLVDGLNAAADFFMMTEVPIAGHIIGFILDDTTNEFDPNSPNFGEKYAPPFMPISIRDWTGREISRTYSDEWGKYNALVPSTYSVNLPMPSGVSPGVLTVSLNDPGPIPGPNGTMIEDPFYNKHYSQFSYTLQYMPGSTTYLDTPVVPVAAFAGGNQFPLDAEYPSGTPKILTVDSPFGGPVAQAQDVITITAVGNQDVPNPAYEGVNQTPPSPKTVTRDYGFGSTKGRVFIGGRQVPANRVTWAANEIQVTIPPVGNPNNALLTGTLMVERGDNGLKTPVGVTMTLVRDTTALPFGVVRVGPNGTFAKIQDGINAANPGDMVLIEPGVYDEMVVMWKPVKLQGYSANSVVIKAIKTPSEKLVQWRQLVDSLINSGSIDLLPGQTGGFETGLAMELRLNEGAGITVYALDYRRADLTDAVKFGVENDPIFSGVKIPKARIDGLTITGGDNAGAILVNGYARDLQISNNNIQNNFGALSGGIRLGHPNLSFQMNNGNIVDQECFNVRVKIFDNYIALNGSLDGAGGGISIHKGSHDYQIFDNMIIGNFSMGNGGGIGHLGVSDSGLIRGNKIIFNQTFNQGQNVNGGGIFIGGQPGLNGAGSLTEGTGDVWVDNNLIQGNNAGVGDGAGICIQNANGLDVTQNRNNSSRWWYIALTDNIVVNNVAGLAGGGIAMQDAVRTYIIHNTVANNDSTATGGLAFTAGSGLNQSNPQPAGLVSRANSSQLMNALSLGNMDLGDFSNPVACMNNIILHNRSFYFYVDESTYPNSYRLIPYNENPDGTPMPGVGSPYWDVAVKGTIAPEVMTLVNNMVEDPALYNGVNGGLDNFSGNPAFVKEYFNASRESVIQQPEITTGITPSVAFDEGGNFIDVRYGPLTLTDLLLGGMYDYHLTSASDAIGRAAVAYPPEVGAAILDLISQDIDGDTRSTISGRVEVGADEL